MYAPDANWIWILFMLAFLALFVWLIIAVIRWLNRH